MMRRIAAALASGATITVFACGGGDNPTPAAPEPFRGPTCNLHLYTLDRDPRCQQAADKSCCNGQRNCAADADCVNIVACVNRCPVGDQYCVEMCTPQGMKTPGMTTFLAMNCKWERQDWLKDVDCRWPR